MKKIFAHLMRFGFLNTIIFILFKLKLIHKLPLCYFLSKQNYYEKLSLDKQKEELSTFYKEKIGSTPNIDKPILFTEKIQWMKFNDSTERKALLSDKYEAVKYIENNYPEELHTVHQLGVWEDASEIDFKSLPEKFVLKCTHGSAMNIIVKDKSKLNIKKTKKQLNDWLKINYATVNGMYENHYSLIKPRIIAEEFITEMDGNLHDYKFHCFHGIPKYCQLIGDRIPNTHKFYQAFYTPEWEMTDITHSNISIYPTSIPKPKKYEEMLKIAAELSKEFNYVRVDLYLLNDEIYFSELTFTPASGIMKFNKKEIDAEWGTWI